MCGYDVPATPGLIGEPDPNALPKGWNAIPHSQASAAYGGDWLRAGDQLGLLLNPLHPAMAEVTLVHQEPFQLDQRLG
jgi:hypothetical protein